MATGNNGPIRVLIVDDHKVVRAGLRSLLAEFPRLQVVGEAATAREAVAEAARLKPEVVVLDLHIGSDSGIELCGRLKASAPGPRILVLTQFSDAATIRAALDAGADGYMLKDSNEEALAAGIVSVAQGDSVLHPVVKRVLMGNGRADGETVPRGKFAQLNPQEQRALALVAEGQTNKEIADALGLSEKTVRNLMTGVMEKLGVERRAQAAAWYVRHAEGNYP